MAKTRTGSGAEDPGPVRPPKPGSRPPGEEPPSEHDSADSPFLRRCEQSLKAIKALLKEGTARTAEKIHAELSSRFPMSMNEVQSILRTFINVDLVKKNPGNRPAYQWRPDTGRD
jgi:hypothetical protein